MSRDDFVNNACNYIKNEQYPNPNDITRWFWNDEKPHAWCGAFIKYIANHNLNCNWLDSCSNFGYVPTIVKWAKDNNYYTTNYKEVKKGDLVIYDFTPETPNGAEHIGIVCESAKDYVISVDGNTNNDKYTNNCVSKRKRNIKYVVGYIKLPYIEYNLKYKLGDKVIINGDLYYSSNTEKPTGKVTNKITEISRINPSGIHQYNTTGDLGWVDEKDIELYEEPFEDYKTLYEREVNLNIDLSNRLKICETKLKEIQEILKK